MAKTIQTRNFTEKLVSIWMVISIEEDHPHEDAKRKITKVQETIDRKQQKSRKQQKLA